MFFPTGKLPHELLDKMVRRYGSKDPDVLAPPAIGYDAAVIDIGEQYLVAKSDPIIFATDQIGWYVVHINANDVACMGAMPRWFLCTMMFPEKNTDEALADEIFSQVHAACESLGVSLVGGHTEIAYGIDRPILSGHMLGLVDKDKIVWPRNAKSGDAVLLVNSFPIEASALLAREKRQELLRYGFSAEQLDRAASYIYEPGLSVVRAARTAGETGEVHSMHDPTEGGVATGLYELAKGAELGIEVQYGTLPFLSDGKAFCEAMGLNPLGAFASGSLLLTVPQNMVETHLEAFRKAKLTAEKIGVLTEDPGRIVMVRDGEEKPITPFDQDEFAKLFD